MLFLWQNQKKSFRIIEGQQSAHMLFLLLYCEVAGLAIMFQSGDYEGSTVCYVFPDADPNLQKHIVLQINSISWLVQNGLAKIPVA